MRARRRLTMVNRLLRKLLKLEQLALVISGDRISACVHLVRATWSLFVGMLMQISNLQMTELLLA